MLSHGDDLSTTFSPVISLTTTFNSGSTLSTGVYALVPLTVTVRLRFGVCMWPPITITFIVMVKFGGNYGASLILGGVG